MVIQDIPSNPAFPAKCLIVSIEMRLRLSEECKQKQSLDHKIHPYGVYKYYTH